ncbi:MAG TPA: efflux transporter outer membrane subunit [Opitutaceae bacterium]|nr:efflux transporter outer membrane subunit [Opitutaceae bacterium]
MKHRSSLPSLACTAALLSLLGGCAVGPDYRQPALPAQVPAFASPADTAAAAASTPWWQLADSPQLAALVERAFAGNRDLRAALAALDEARALRREGNAGFFPVSTISAGYRRQLDSTVFFPGTTRNQRDNQIFDIGVDSAWELDLFGRVRRMAEAGDALTAAAAADLAQFRLVIAAETARAYTALAVAQAALPLQERQLAAAIEALRLTRCQVEQGKLLPDQLAPAETEVAVAQTTLRDLQLAARNARNRLGVLVGDGPQLEIGALALPQIPAPAFPADATALLTRRPDVLAAERRLAASNAAIGVVTADYFPTVSFVARAGAEATRLDRLDSADANFFAFGPRLQWDLLNLHRTVARVQGAKARNRQALAAWENSVLLALEEIDNALALRAESFAKLQDWRRAETAALDAARVAQLRAAAGRLDPVDALATERSALQTQLARLRAEADLASASIFLQQSVALDR